MNPLVYIVVFVAIVVILALFLMGKSSPDRVEEAEDKLVDQETPAEMQTNLKEFEEESKKYQVPNDRMGYDDK